MYETGFGAGFLIIFVSNFGQMDGVPPILAIRREPLLKAEAFNVLVRSGRGYGAWGSSTRVPRARFHRRGRVVIDRRSRHLVGDFLQIESELFCHDRRPDALVFSIESKR